MNCHPYVKKESDKPYWVPIKVFQENFCQKDFLCRDVIDVVDEYRSNWFFEIDGRTCFEIPPVDIINGRTEFISGRHRTAVLCKHITVLPIAFAEGDALSYAVSLGLAPISMTEPISLPDLQIIEGGENL